MFAPALMVRIIEPASQLYELSGISDEELWKANRRFMMEDLPYRVRRKTECVLQQVAA